MVYKERPKIEQMVRSNMPLLKSFKEFEYGFKIRDKENPKNWCAAAPSGMPGVPLRPSSPCARSGSFQALSKGVKQRVVPTFLCSLAQGHALSADCAHAGTCPRTSP